MKNLHTSVIAGALIVCALVLIARIEPFSDPTNGTVSALTEEASKKGSRDTVIASGTVISKLRQSNSTQTNHSSERSTRFPSVGNKESGELHSIDDIEFHIGRFKDLMYIDSPGFSMEERIAVEEDLLNLLNGKPESISKLFELYTHSPDFEYKQTIIDVLSMTENPQIEQFALTQLHSEFDDHTVGWLQILRSTGISSVDDRANLLSRLYQYSDPSTLSNAISALKFRPVPASQSERHEIVTRLQIYLTHEDPRVQQAASAVIANWNLESRQGSI